MTERKYPVADDQFRVITRRMTEINRRLDCKSGSSLNPMTVADQLQEIIEGKVRLTGLEGAFQLEDQFRFTVPQNYVHDSWLVRFKSKHMAEFDKYNSDITDAHFSKPTVRLQPGQKLLVKVFCVVDLDRPSEDRIIGHEECLAFLKAQRALLVGAQGSALVFECAKERVAYSAYNLSLDEKTALYKEPRSGCHMIPHLSQGSDEEYIFDLRCFEKKIDSATCVLAFFDESRRQLV